MAPTNPLSLRPLPLGEGAQRLRPLGGEGTPIRPHDGEGKATPSFLETLKESMQQVNALQKQADQAINDLATGEKTDIAQTMIAVQKASLSFQLMTQVRNRILQAYEDVMRMPV